MAAGCGGGVIGDRPEGGVGAGSRRRVWRGVGTRVGVPVVLTGVRRGDGRRATEGAARGSGAGHGRVLENGCDCTPGSVLMFCMSEGARTRPGRNSPDRVRESDDTPKCAGGGIGRRAGFRFQCPKGRGGSTPPSRTDETPGPGFPDRGLALCRWISAHAMSAVHGLTGSESYVTPAGLCRVGERCVTSVTAVRKARVRAVSRSRCQTRPSAESGRPVTGTNVRSRRPW